MRPMRVVGLAAMTCAVTAALAASSIAKDPRWIGPVNQPPGTLGQATVELKIHFGRKSHGSKKLVPKSLLAKEHNVYYDCLDGKSYYLGAGGDASTQSKVEIEETIFVKKNRTFNVTDTNSGDTDTGTFNLQGRIGRTSASGTLRMENHENDGSRLPATSTPATRGC